MYEPHHRKPLSRGKFAVRMLRHLVVAMAAILLSLLAGMAGFHHFEQMTWLDSFVNASMLLGGMGPMKTEGLSTGGKYFAGMYALYSGLVFIAVMGLMVAPIFHRVLHIFHWEQQRHED